MGILVLIRHGESQWHLENRFTGWVDVPLVKAGKTVLVAAHGNSLRSLVMPLDQLAREQVLELNLGTGVPIVYELDADGRVEEKKIL